VSTSLDQVTDILTSTQIVAPGINEKYPAQKREFLNHLHVALSSAGGQPRLAASVECNIYTFWGDVMTVTLPEVVSSEIAMSGAYEIDLTVALIQRLEPGMVFFDVGAHRGYFSMLAARLVGPTGQVHAFEPTPGTYELLSANVRAHRNVHTNNLAVYSESKELIFHDLGLCAPAFNSIYTPRMSKEDSARIPMQDRRVQAVSIDDYVWTSGARPSFIKIDAESAELDIVRGMAKTLRTIRPAFTLEVGDMDLEGVPSTRDLIHFACSFGYIPMEITGGQITNHQIKERYGYGNLLFVPSEQLARH
jgi:FkbM family methyltransferase